MIQAIEQVIQNPSVILNQIGKLDQMEADQTRAGLAEAKEVEQESNRIRAEEERVLDAYRAAIISPPQLGQQLEKLKTRRAALEARRTTLVQNPTLPREQVEKSVKDYCQEAARKIKSFTREAWREFLRLVVRNIVFEGSHVRIQGQIPAVDNADASDAGFLPGAAGFLDGRIATMTAYHRGRNPGGEYRDSESSELIGVQTFPYAFEVTPELMRPPVPEQPRDELGRFCSNPKVNTTEGIVPRAA